MGQIGQATAIPIVHLVELLDWATGGTSPAGLPAGEAEALMPQAREAAMLKMCDPGDRMCFVVRPFGS
jgi:glycolate oxidase iron-sulfur subunit